MFTVLPGFRASKVRQEFKVHKGRRVLPEFQVVQSFAILSVCSSSLLIEHLNKGRDGSDGKDGRDGVEGKDGKDGQDGAPGMTGITRQFRGLNSTGVLI